MKILKKSLLLTFSLALPLLAMQAGDVQVRIHADQGKTKINKEIYGQFAEHLGTCIYGGLWVGPDSPIANRDGYRLDVLNALKELQVPVLRWPGGCFADDYHWMDGDPLAGTAGAKAPQAHYTGSKAGAAAGFCPGAAGSRARERRGYAGCSRRFSGNGLPC